MLDSTKVWNSEEFHYFLVMTKDDGKGYICSGCTQMYGKCHFLAMDTQNPHMT